MDGDKDLAKGESTQPSPPATKNIEGFAASVELPEGHQLVIGELPPGTVVEVATWQGTGRPDESTNRFLLSASGSGLSRRERKNSATSPQLDQPNNHLAATPSAASTITSESFLGLKEFGVSASAKEESSMKANALSNWFRAILAVLSTIAICSLVLSLLGFGALVPTRGVNTAIGSSVNSLIIYKKSSTVGIGELTVAQRSDGAHVFGPSNTFDSNSIQLQTSAGQEVVLLSEVKGRAFLAVPLLGWPLKPLLG